MFSSLDFVYVPAADVDAAAAHYRDTFGGELLWKVRGMGTTVAAVRISDEGPLVLLSGHLHGETPILVYRVDSYANTVRDLRLRGMTGIVELEIPHGPCASFRATSGQRVAVYELVRPDANDHFLGRFDD